MKKIGKVVLMALFGICLFTMQVKADGLDELGKVVDGSVLTDDEASEITEMNYGRGNILESGTVKITNNGNGTVNIHGSAMCYVTCDKVIVDLTLQQYKNGGWYNYGTYPATVYNAHSLTRSYNIPITKGYYYRVKGACVAQKGNTTESQDPITNGLWIG